MMRRDEDSRTPSDNTLELPTRMARVIGALSLLAALFAGTLFNGAGAALGRPWFASTESAGLRFIALVFGALFGIGAAVLAAYLLSVRAWITVNEVAGEVVREDRSVFSRSTKALAFEDDGDVSIGKHRVHLDDAEYVVHSIVYHQGDRCLELDRRWRSRSALDRGEMIARFLDVPLAIAHPRGRTRPPRSPAGEGSARRA